MTAVLVHTLVLRDRLLDRMALWRTKPSPKTARTRKRGLRSRLLRRLPGISLEHVNRIGAASDKRIRWAWTIAAFSPRAPSSEVTSAANRASRLPEDDPHAESVRGMGDNAAGGGVR